MIKFQIEIRETGDAIDTFDTLEEAEKMVDEYVEQDKSEWQIVTWETDGEGYEQFAAQNTNGSLEGADFVGTQEECKKYIDKKCSYEYYNIVEVEA